MFKTITGKDLSEREASLLINLLDLTEGYKSLITTGTSGMVVSVGQAGNISVAPVAAEQIYSVKESEPSGSSCNAVGSDSVQPITTSQRDHIQGYDWQIVVLSREKDPRDSYVVHFAHQPTQEQFEEHFAKFVARTHYVHVNEWDRGHQEWVGITTRFPSAPLSRSSKFMIRAGSK